MRDGGLFASFDSVCLRFPSVSAILEKKLGKGGIHMREMAVCTRGAEDQEGRARRYAYSILIDEMDVGPFACESYGVKIREEGTGQTAVAPHVTTSIPRIDELMDLLTRNTVTPAGLGDVLADWL